MRDPGKTFRLFLPVAALGLLASCGFAPVYGSHETRGPTAEALNDVFIDNIPDHEGQILRNNLIDRMYGKGRPAAPQYHLALKIHDTVADLGIQADSTSTRTMLDTSVDYDLMDMKDKIILHGTAHSITSFNKLANQYGSLAADESARERTLNEVSDQIVNRLSLYFADPPPKKEETKKDDVKNDEKK